MGPNYGIPYSNGLGAAPPGQNNGAGNVGSSSGGGIPSWMESIFSGLFGNSGSPYSAAGNAYNQYAQMGANAINPYNKMGQGAMTNYGNWAQAMSNPSAFENNLMNQYQESPQAKFMQQQALRSAANAGSAAGTVGSTPYALQNEQNAENISQQDMGNWLNNALGINSQYGAAQNNMMNAGEQGANSLLNLYGQEAQAQGEAAYGQAAGQNQDSGNFMNGVLGGIGSFFGL